MKKRRVVWVGCGFIAVICVAAIFFYCEYAKTRKFEFSQKNITHISAVMIAGVEEMWTYGTDSADEIQPFIQEFSGLPFSQKTRAKDMMYPSHADIYHFYCHLADETLLSFSLTADGYLFLGPHRYRLDDSAMAELAELLHTVSNW